jgi:hypothetical protein
MIRRDGLGDLPVKADNSGYSIGAGSRGMRLAGAGAMEAMWDG